MALVLASINSGELGDVEGATSLHHISVRGVVEVNGHLILAPLDVRVGVSRGLTRQQHIISHKLHQLNIFWGDQLRGHCGVIKYYLSEGHKYFYKYFFCNNYWNH